MRKTYVKEVMRTAPITDDTRQNVAKHAHQILAIVGIMGELAEATEATEASTLFFKQKVAAHENLIKEFGDVTWYCGLLCHVENISIADLLWDDEVVARKTMTMRNARRGDTTYAVKDALHQAFLYGGKLSELYKKVAFHGHKHETAATWFLLSEVLHNLQIASALLGYSIDVVMQRNITKLQARYPNGFDQRLSQTKNESRE